MERAVSSPAFARPRLPFRLRPLSPWPGKQYVQPRPIPARLPMTVCVAVVAENEQRIVCANDRMLTILGMEFEPDTSKMFLPDGPLGFLYAGDASWCTEVISNTIDSLPALGSPPWDIAQVAARYEAEHRAVLHRKIDAEVLGKWGITLRDLRSPRRKLRPEVVGEAMRGIAEYETHKLPETQAIIAGINPVGVAELWVVNNGIATVSNVPGFAAIGGGSYRAYSQMMLRKWDTGRSRAEALWLAYAAKCRADEIVGGVGRKTDVFEIGPDMTRFAAWRTDLAGRLESVYKQWRAAADINYKVALSSVHQTVPSPEDVLFAMQQPVAGVAPPVPLPASTDGP